MLRLASITTAAALLLWADVSGVIHLRPPSQHAEIPSDENLPVLPDMSQGHAPLQTTQGDAAENAGEPAKAINGPLRLTSRLALVRYVDGEFARVVSPLPGGKNGFHITAGGPVDEKQLRMALGSSGAAVNPGDRAQITDLEFRDREIIVDVNGGGRGKTKLRDRIHMDVSGMPSVTSTGPDHPVNTNAGATIYLDFNKPLPDMTPDDLKQHLSGLLDFSKQHSAAVQWVDTLPPDIQNAIKDKRPVVGMDREMVLAAIGRPDRKVREKTADGGEAEDWIYGKPPAKTVFVTFEGDKVTQVEQFPR